MSVFFPALPVNARLAAIMDNFLAIGLGLAVRYVIDIVSRNDTKMSGTLVGMWEGIALSHFLKKMPNSFDPIIGYALRLFCDYYLNENLTRLILVIIWTGLGVILADITPALWVDVGLHRYWRRFRRDLYYMSRSMPKVDIFPRARTVRFSPTHPATVLSDSDTTVTPSVISTTQALPTVRRPAPNRTVSKRHVPGSFESEADTNTEPGSVPPRQSELPSSGFQAAQIRRRQSIYPAFTPDTRDNASEVTSVGHDVDEGNLSSPVSEGLTEDGSAANPNDIPGELEYVDVQPETKEKSETPKQHNAGLPTPTESTHPFDPMRRDDEYVRPPPPADIRTIPDSYDMLNAADDWEKVNKADATTLDNAPPPLPEKDDTKLPMENTSPPPQPVPPPVTYSTISTIQKTRDSTISEKPPPYQDFLDTEGRLPDPILEKPHPAGDDEVVHNTIGSTEPPASGEEQAHPGTTDGAEDESNLSDLSETTLQSLEGLSCLDQMAKLHQLIAKARSEYEKAERGHGSVQTSGNRQLANQAKSKMVEREKRLKKLTHKAEACFLTHNESGRKFTEEVDLSNAKERSELEVQVQKALEHFLRPSVEQATFKFLTMKGKPGAPQRAYILDLVKSLGLTPGKDLSNARVLLVHK